MSTFLVSFGVVAVATVCVVVIALSDPEQPATPRRPTGRERTRRRSSWTPRRVQAQAWVRVRSGLALVALVAFVGVLMAVMVGTSLALAARALQRAVG